ncbi:MAG: transglutaminase-like cysteine peptidase [Gammaproteobacteria bacterium]|nr:transglutaminase-like cysteine peptidase [Gammaproteobacteria bacterium]
MTLLLFVFACLFALAAQTIQLFSEQKYQLLKSQYGQQVTNRLDDWKILVEQNQNKSETEKLHLVNDFFNQKIRWVDDKKLWKQRDYWATPLESLTKGAGDCEDFSIAKYYTLHALGLPINKLKITYVKALEYNQAHMVLTYYASKKSEPLILDNINKKILKGSKREDLKPVYSFNGEGMWISKQKKLGKKVGSSQRIRLWTDLVTRINKELE